MNIEAKKMSNKLMESFQINFGKRVRQSLGFASITVLAFTTALHPIATVSADAQQRTGNYVKLSESSANEPMKLQLGLNKSIVIDLPAEAHDILVANPDVADAVTRTSRRIYLFGKEIGQTNIFVFDGQGRQIAGVDLTIERDIAGLEDYIHKFLPGSDVRAELSNDNVILTGHVRTPLDAARAVQMAEIFVNNGGQQRFQNGNSFFGNGLTRAESSKVVNLLKIDGEDQVHLKVVVAEIQRNVIKQLGITTSISNSSTNDGFGFQSLLGGSFQQSVAPADSATLSVTQGLSSLSSTMAAAERAGVMRTLAEPSLTAVSGEQAHFRSGGRYNVLSEFDESGDEGRSYRYEQLRYGISLSFTPVVLSEGRISLKIRTEVSEPTTRGASNVAKFGNLPGIRERVADTTVELPSGGSMVIGGLIQDDVRQAINGYPGLKSIPIFGSLFRSREFQRNETELLVLVTPYLVRPTARSKIARPDEGFQAASDAAGYFMGRVNRVYGTKQGNLPKGRYTGSIGFILK